MPLQYRQALPELHGSFFPPSSGLGTAIVQQVPPLLCKFEGGVPLQIDCDKVRLLLYEMIESRLRT